MTLAEFLNTHERVILVRVTGSDGSAPRGEGTRMLVSAEALFGTVGGGVFEHRASNRARAMLEAGEAETELDMTLGPDTGQCCGGRMRAHLSLLDAPGRAALLAEDAAAHAELPLVLIFGAGHVGRALAQALVPLPLRVRLIDERAGQLALAPGGIETCLTPLPEVEIAAAPPCAALVTMTHDHGLDFLIAEAALRRGDLAFVGMIGSRSKRAAFDGKLRREAPELDPARLTCPLGAFGVSDKRPEVIAALITVDLLKALL